MRRALILVLMAMLTTPTAAPARVLQSVTPDNALAEGPLLAGNRVAWEENRCVSPGRCGFEAARRYRIRAAGPAGVRTLSEGRLQSLPGGSNSFFSSVSFDLSARGFLLARSALGTSDEQPFASERLYAGERDGSAQVRLVRCRAAQQTTHPGFALAGRLLAYEAFPCDEQAALTVRDLSTATSRDIALVPGDRPLEDLAIAGRWMASAHAGQVQLHDVRTGVVAFAAALPPGVLHGIDVARDGRLAVAVGPERIGIRSCRSSRLWLRGASGGDLELQAGRPCWDARLVRGGIAYLGGGRRPGRLELLTDAGRRRTVVEFRSRHVRESFDAQGTRAAFAARCGGRMRIRVVSLGAPARTC